ncbi:MAG: hypothetical protein WDN28_27190 [Chthoniobacter sp.]
MLARLLRAIALVLELGDFVLGAAEPGIQLENLRMCRIAAWRMVSNWRWVSETRRACSSLPR